MYIGEVAQRTGATPKAIRLYETLGLISVPERKGKYRYFQEQDVDQIQIIKQAQRLGFRLAELQEMLDQEISCDAFPWDEAIVLVEEKVERIRSEIEKLEKQKVELIEFAKGLTERKCNQLASVS
jgi:MerR family transcriptional regulator, copper efflux regulator